jgi:hypothetical protein
LCILVINSLSDVKPKKVLSIIQGNNLIIFKMLKSKYYI